jgi:hypothetical protein
MTRWLPAILAASILLTLGAPARADDVLHPGSTKLDRPTLTALGVQLLITGDDNHNAKVELSYRVKGTTAWKMALPLWRVRPEVVVGRTVPEQFAGSAFDLKPATTYELQLHATDPDGAVDQTLTVEGTTRAVPGDPPAPNKKRVTDVATLNAAVGSAKAGDVIELASGTYAGTFSWTLSGAADNPVVIRGETQDGVVLDGQGAAGNVIELYGSFIHLEKLTVQNGNRAVRFQTPAAEGNVVRRVHIKNVVLGIGSKNDQKDFYIADNLVEGRLVWPAVYADDGGKHANDDGIHVEGDGHVVCHNTVVGFGDAMKVEQDGARAVDFYNNEILSAYDNGLELDGTEGNSRCIRNRFTNTYATISFQPIFGGPAYCLRNVVVNVANEQMKFHALGTQPPETPSGILVYHNTFVSPKNALFLATGDYSHHFVIENNLFFGPPSPDNNKTVDWEGPIDDGTFDYDAYYPDKEFRFNLAGALTKYSSFAQMQAAGIETHGVLLSATPFANGLVPPAAYTITMAAQDVTLAAGSPPIDKGIVLANINDGFRGAAPDLGADELGCGAPIYGPRPEGTDETNEPTGCAPPNPPGSDAGVAGPDASNLAPADTGLSPGLDAAAANTDSGASPSDAATGPADVGTAPADTFGSGPASSGCGCAAPGADLSSVLLFALASLRVRRRGRAG